MRGSSTTQAYLTSLCWDYLGGLPPEIMAFRRQQTESFWRREQDILADIMRQMRLLSRDRENHPEVWTYNNLGAPRSLAYPNLVLTRKHSCPAQAYQIGLRRVSADAGLCAQTLLPSTG